MDAHDLARWTRFAAKGGIGKCTAVVDCIAQEMGEDLMFLKDDEITVLMQLPEAGIYLGHCEGVVGRFSGKDVRFYGKLKKPIMAKRSSIGPGTDSRRSISLNQGNGSRTDLTGEKPRHTSESPSYSRPGSRTKQTPSPTHFKSHAPMRSYSTSYSCFSEDQSSAALSDFRSTTMVGTSHAPTVKESRASSMKSGHAKPPQMATSISGASVFSVGSASIYSDASTATTALSASERARSRNGSLYSIDSGDTEKDPTEYGNVDQATGASSPMPVSMSDTTLPALPPASSSTSNVMFSTSVSTSSSMSASTSASGTSFASTSTYGPETANGSFGSVGSISELEAKQFDLSKFGMHPDAHTGFVLVPPPLGMGDDRKSLASPVAPLRVTKSPRLTPSPGLPPSSPLPVPPMPSGETPRSTSASPALPSAPSPGILGPLSPKFPGFPGSLSPGLPGSLAPGPRSPGLPGSLSPGFRSPVFPHGSNTQSQYTFSSRSSPHSPSPYGSTPSPSLPSPFGVNRNNASTPPNVRTPPVASSPFGLGQPIRAPLSPPPTTPLPPVPSATLPSPTLSVAFLPKTGVGPSMGTAATAAASGRTSPLAALSSSLPSSTLGIVHADDRHGRRDVDKIEDERMEETWDEEEEEDTTRLSTLDAFRRQFGDVNEIGYGVHSENEEERTLGLDEGESKDEKKTGTSRGGEVEEEEEGAHSDGEVGIGLSLMGALGDEDDEDDAKPAETKGGNDRELGVDDAGVGVIENTSGISGENRGTTPMAWTRYTPTSPINVHGFSGQRRNSEGEDGNEDEDDGAYWDDIYDDYRYSRYSLASKRFSVTSKASGASKGSSKARANAPPMPVPPDQRSLDTPRPSIGSDGTNGYARPSLESSTSSTSSSMPFTRPSLTRSTSDRSMHELPLTAQFPAVPVHVPVRTESRLRIVHDGHLQSGDDHGEREQQVLHGSTEVDARAIGLNIEVIEAPEEDDAQGQEVSVAKLLTSLNHTALSPLLHTTFGSPHSSRFTDLEDGSDQDHVRRYSNKSGKLTLTSVEEPPKSPIDGGGMASALKAKMEAERATSSDAVPSPVAPPSTSDPLPSKDTTTRAIVVDDDEGLATGVNSSVNNPVLATPPLPVQPLQTPNAAQATVATEPKEASPSVDRLDDAEKSPFLRPRPQPSHSPHPFVRTSMFLPHPNAPKVVHQSQGPMYGRTIPQPYTYPVLSEPGAGTTYQPTPPGTTFYSTHILHQLRNLSIAAFQGQPRRSPLTVFARCQPDLSASMGPVPILFSLDPLPPLPTPPTGAHTQMVGGRVTPYAVSMTPTRAATVSAPVRRGGGNEDVPAKEVGSSVGNASSLRLPKRSATTVTTVGDSQGTSAGPSSPSLPIPREGFVPQVGVARPRSRSFSAFGAHVSVAPQERSREEPVMRRQDGAVIPQRNPSLPPALTARHAPSPLVLRNSSKDHGPSSTLKSPVVQSPTLSMQHKVPLSPFTQEPLTRSPQFIDTMQVAHTNGILASPIASSPLMNSPDKDPSFIPGAPGVIGGTSMSLSDRRNASTPPSLMPGRQGSLDIPQSSPVEGPPRQSSDSSDSRSLASPPPIPEVTLQSARSSPLAQEAALRTKLSLPALRIKANGRPKLDDAISVVSLAISGENETVQVQDMDFELVKPSLPPVPGRASQDSTLTGREIDSARPDVSPILGDGASMYSNAPRSPLAPTHVAASTESAESIDAHRQRELKWMSFFPTVPPSQARKNKKVRKMLQEGVPSSVRYLVWCHLTDSKARALPGVYAKLGKRMRVPAFAEIEKDAEQNFPDQSQLHTSKGPLVSLLQAYLSMVPDIQYNSGLTLIAGHLLLLAPEEDAFWIFTSMMDAHLRTYFAANAVQIEIDASLFSKALEAIDPVLTKKLYVQLSIAPASITQPWFSTLFVGSLSVDLLHRVWDLFLYDGISYLFRIGLVVVNCVRHLLLQAQTEEAALAHLAHPPPACLPSATELLVLAANVKLKDDDVRKQRIKMEQQLKRTTQVRPPNGMSNVHASAISLPRT